MPCFALTKAGVLSCSFTLSWARFLHKSVSESDSQATDNPSCLSLPIFWFLPWCYFIRCSANEILMCNLPLSLTGRPSVNFWLWPGSDLAVCPGCWRHSGAKPRNGISHFFFSSLWLTNKSLKNKLSKSYLHIHFGVNI